MTSSFARTSPRLTDRLARSVSALPVALGIAVLAWALSAGAPGATAQSRCGSHYKFGTYGVGNWPSACWRPYSSSSPFNTRVGRSPRVKSNSKQIVRRLIGGGPVTYLVAGDPDRGGSPTYYSQQSDPVYRLDCIEPWGRCEIEGMRVRIPSQAEPTGGIATPKNDHDAHMTVIDQATGWEYDFFHVVSKPADGGTLTFGWGGRTRITGKGLGSRGVAAGFGNLAGLIRAQELAKGRIDHALTMAVPCVRGKAVYPATSYALSCNEAGLPSRNAPHLGAHFQLRIGHRKLARMPFWKRGIAEALKRYGAYVNDTTGNPEWWGFSIEGPATYTSFGYRDPMADLGKRLGFEPVNYIRNSYREYWFKLSSAIPWKRMRVVGSCAARGRC